MREALLEHLYSGHLFFSAALLFVAVSLLDLFHRLDGRPAAARIAQFLAVLAIPLAAISGTPLPLVVAIPVALVALAWALAGFGTPPLIRRTLGISAVAGALLVAALELPWHLTLPPTAPPSRIFVVGDSLSSGGFGEREPWPSLLERQTGIPVTNLALPSETATTALRNQLPELPSPDPQQWVVVAVGGNDMLEGQPAARFEAALDAIVAQASEGGRKALLIELPVLPGAWRYAAAQRRVARRHDARLIPKRLLTSVLVEPENTFDGVHLTSAGHRALADALVEWSAGSGEGM